MPLEQLHQLIIHLRQTIQEERPALSQNEALTRYALIDPLLRELGWDTANPIAVFPEYPIDIYGGNRARADYALLDDSANPFIMIEAKKLGEPLLTGTAVNQGMQACLNTNTPFFAATDGDHWTIYDMLKQAMPAEKLIVEFTISAEPPEQTMLKALALNRLNAAIGVITPASPPLIAQQPTTPTVIQDIPETPAPIEQSPNVVTRALSDIAYKKRDPAPIAVIFPDGKKIPHKQTWSDAAHNILTYMTLQGIITADMLPIGTDVINLVATEPVHPTGREFKTSRTVGPFHVNMDTSPTAFISRIREILTSKGEDPETYLLVFQESSN